MPSYIHSLYHLSLGGDAKLLSPSVVGWVRLLGRHSLICPQYLFNGIISSWWFQPMKNMSQIENLPQVRVKIQNIWNHQDIQSASYRLSVFYSPKSLFVFSPHEHLHLDACLKKPSLSLQGINTSHIPNHQAILGSSVSLTTTKNTFFKVILDKLSYFTNLDFPQISRSPIFPSYSRIRNWEFKKPKVVGFLMVQNSGLPPAHTPWLLDLSFHPWKVPWKGTKFQK